MNARTAAKGTARAVKTPNENPYEVLAFENPYEVLAFLHSELSELAETLLADSKSELGSHNTRAAARCFQAHLDVRGFADFTAAHLAPRCTSPLP